MKKCVNCGNEAMPGFIVCPTCANTNAVPKKLAISEREQLRLKWAQQTAELVNKKNKAYGDSFQKSGEILHIMCPEIPVEKCVMILAVARILDKQFRLLTDPSAFNEDPADDLIGYGLLLKELLHNNKKGQ